VIRISAAALHVGQSIDVLLDEPQRWHYSKGGGIAMDVVYADGRITSDLALTRTRWDSMRVVPSADGDA
jgi:hypothetical protein